MLLGTLIAGLVHVLLPPGFIHRRLQGPSGVLKAVGIGVPLPLCSCGVIPAGLGLKKDGASDGACIGFLISTPQTGVDSILVSGSFLGWPFALFKVVVAAVTGLAGGWLVDALAGNRGGQVESPLADAPPNRSRGVRELVAHGLAQTTPAAIVQHGTTPSQRTVVGTLATLHQLALAAQLAPPTLIIIGDVVRLQPQLGWYEAAAATALAQ